MPYMNKNYQITLQYSILEMEGNSETLHFDQSKEYNGEAKTILLSRI